jgi:putative tricarboxylic transport membrane protein
VLEFLGLASWSSGLTALVVGSSAGFLLGLTPGLGGRIGIILCLPLAVFFPPFEAAIFLFSMHAVVNTSGAIPNIAFAVPSSPSDMATIIDGYPLAKMGRAGEALGASLSASAIGGVLGALAFLASIPIARPLVTSFGPPEFFLLAIFSMTMVASVSREGLLPGGGVGCLGVLAAMVGGDFRTGEPRFTFGWLELWDGIGLPALVCGLFVVPEMLSIRSLEEKAHQRAISTTVRDVYKGMFVTLKHMRVVIRSTIYGIFVGFMPAVGTSMAAWMSYDYAARTTKSDIPFGQGAIAGVIAPEAANNSEEGGAMIPTLFFGIPGSSSMAIMIGALAFAGVAVGPNMLTTDIGLSFSLAAAVILANLIVVPLFFLVIPSIVKLSALRREAIAPFAIVLSVSGALIDTPRPITVVLVAIGSLLGIALKLANWPRAPVMLGYVVGIMAERSYFHTVEIYGWTALSRPMTILLGLATVGWLAYVTTSRPVTRVPGPRTANVLTSAGFIVGFAIVIFAALHTISGSGRLAPIAVALLGGILCIVMLYLALTSPDHPTEEPIRHAGAFALYLLAIPIFGFVAAGAFFIAGFLMLIGVTAARALIGGAIYFVLQFIVLFAVFDVLVEKEVLGRIVWAFMGY